MIKNLIIFFFASVAFLSLILNLRFYQYKKSQNTVTEVVDGDTFQLASGKRVRLMGVDAPEYNRCAGPEAKKHLADLILNKQVTLKESQQETFGRTLALVYLYPQTSLISLTSPTLINELILKQGWARTDYRKNSKREMLTAAFHQAQQKKLGIWSSLCRDYPDSPNKLNNPNRPNCLIKANIDKVTYQKFYHLPNCKQYNQIIIEKDIGEGYFCTEEEAQKAGFKKASGCP